MTFGGRFSLVAFSVIHMPLVSWGTAQLNYSDVSPAPQKILNN
jgi:hypothetical protein